MITTNNNEWERRWAIDQYTCTVLVEQPLPIFNPLKVLKNEISVRLEWYSLKCENYIFLFNKLPHPVHHIIYFAKFTVFIYSVTNYHCTSNTPLSWRLSITWFNAHQYKAYYYVMRHDATKHVSQQRSNQMAGNTEVLCSQQNSVNNKNSATLEGNLIKRMHLLVCTHPHWHTLGDPLNSIVDNTIDHTFLAT